MSAPLRTVLLLVIVWAASPSAYAAAATEAGIDPAAARAQQFFVEANAYWAGEFKILKAGYLAPTLGFDAHSLADGCSEGSAIVGPFYCPDESRVYLSQDFLHKVQSTAGAAADLALAYIVGHEVGAHIQDLIGTTEQVEKARANSTPALSARTWTLAQLQSDCYAGLWVRAAEAAHQIEGNDVVGALDAVATASQSAQASLGPGEARADPMLTYGTQAQRLAWFHRGMDSGNFADCDTFAAGGKL